MSPRLIQRHDQFFKRLLDKPGAAGALLRERLPPEVAEILSDEPPELMPGSFIPPELMEYRTDRLYRARTKKTGRPVYIYALLEHKSSPEKRVGFQLLGYIYNFLSWWEKNEGEKLKDSEWRLPAVIPLIVYHGDEKWNVPPSLADVTDADEEIIPYILDFRYILVNLETIDDHLLSHNEALRIGFLILKHGKRGGNLRETLLFLAELALSLGFNDLVALIRYIIDEPNELEAETLRDVLKKIMPGQEDRVMSIFGEQLRNEGFNLGVIQGEATGKANMLLRQLRRRFKSVPSHVEELVLKASSDQLDEWSELLIDNKLLTDIFGPALSH